LSLALSALVHPTTSFPRLIEAVIRRHAKGHALAAFICAVLQQDNAKANTTASSTALTAAENVPPGNMGLQCSSLERVTRSNSLLATAVSSKRRQSFTQSVVPVTAILEEGFDRREPLNVAQIATGLIGSGVVPHLLTAIDTMLSDLRAQHIGCMAIKLLATSSMTNMLAVCKSCMAQVRNEATLNNTFSTNQITPATEQHTNDKQRGNDATEHKTLDTQVRNETTEQATLIRPFF
jgi:hypothetical protein